MILFFPLFRMVKCMAIIHIPSYVTEPTTLVTDYLLGAAIIWFAVQLFRHARLSAQRSVLIWAAGFAATAIATIAGGTEHGFVKLLGEVGDTFAWKTTVFAIGAAGFLLFSSAVLATIEGPVARLFLFLAAATLGIYCSWMMRHDQFIYVIVDYAPSLLGVALLHACAWRKNRDKNQAAPWLVSGVIVAFIAAGVQASGFDLHRFFNHNDLYHVIQFGAMWLFYRGGMKMTDVSSTESSLLPSAPILNPNDVGIAR